jgi:polyadenylate-binding protein
MNFTDINAKPCRIMWSQRDPSLRKTGLGNVFVSNLAPTVDNKGLYDTFSVFGNILSCKVATDETGKSKGYGYVHFETAEAAEDAIQKFNGMLIEDVEVHVGHFVRRQDRAGQTKWTNLYIKQFPVSWDEPRLREMFGAFGTISSVAISKDETGKSKGFGFINYADHEAASKAVDELNGKTVTEDETNYTLYVGKAQKKAERVREMRSRQDQLNLERVTKYQGMNLYVKNISDTISDEIFRDSFAPFGTITSARIMRETNEPKTSKGFGFVCYSNPEDAAKAVAEMNGKVLGGKPLVVTFYQRKDVRRAQLAATYAPQNMRFPQNMPAVPFMQMYMPQQGGFPGQAQPRGAMPYGFPPNAMPARGAPNAGPPRGAVPFPARGGYGFPGVPGYMQAGGQQVPQQPGGLPQGARPRGQMNPAYPVPQNAGMPPNFGGQPGQMPRRMPQGPGVPGGVPQGVPRGAPMQQGGRPMYPPVPGQMGQFPGQPPMPPAGQVPRGQQAMKFTNQARNQNAMPGMIPQPMMPGQQPMQQMPGLHQIQQQPAQKMDFSEALLATTDPMQQKNMIGEKLYPLIYREQPEQAGKITGMLLEMDNGELLHLLESPEALHSKIEEAMSVLRSHKIVS